MLRDLDFWAKEFGFSAQEVEVENGADSREGFAGFGFPTGLQANIAGFDADGFEPEGVGDVEGPEDMIFLGDECQLPTSEDVASSGDGVKRAETGVIEDHAIGGNTLL